MLVEEIVRRNRRRIVVMIVFALADCWLLSSVIFGLAISRVVLRLPVDAPGVVIVGASLSAGAVAATWFVATDLRSMHRRTLDDLGAVEIGPGELPVVENLLHELGIAIGAPPVRAALVADDAPNVLAVGRRPEDTTIAVTSGLVQKLTRDELEAVLAVELWAIRRYDTALQTVTLVFTGDAITTHAGFSGGWKNPLTWPWIALTFPMTIVAEILRSRTTRNDSGADALAVATTRDPDALRRAIEKLRDDKAVVETLSPTTAPLWFEPILRSKHWRTEDVEGVALAPSLDDRLTRLDDQPRSP